MSGTWATHPFPPNQHLHFSPLRRVQEHRDTDGHLHRIIVQNEEMSCGPAALAMLIDLLRGGSAADIPGFERRLKVIAGNFPGSMVAEDRRTGSQGPLSGHQGSQMTNLEAVLANQHVRIRATWHRWEHRPSVPGVIAADFVRQKPALLLWGWYDARNVRQGGHFNVAARLASNHTVVIIDPWDGSLHQIAPTARYRGTGQLDGAVYVA